MMGYYMSVVDDCMSGEADTMKSEDELRSLGYAADRLTMDIRTWVSERWMGGRQRDKNDDNFRGFRI